MVAAALSAGDRRAGDRGGGCALDWWSDRIPETGNNILDGVSPSGHHQDRQAGVIGLGLVLLLAGSVLSFVLGAFFARQRSVVTPLGSGDNAKSTIFWRSWKVLPCPADSMNIAKDVLKIDKSEQVNRQLELFKSRVLGLSKTAERKRGDLEVIIGGDKKGLIRCGIGGVGWHVGKGPFIGGDPADNSSDSGLRGSVVRNPNDVARTIRSIRPTNLEWQRRGIHVRALDQLVRFERGCVDSGLLYADVYQDAGKQRDYKRQPNIPPIGRRLIISTGLVICGFLWIFWRGKYAYDNWRLFGTPDVYGLILIWLGLFVWWGTFVWPTTWGWWL